MPVGRALAQRGERVAQLRDLRGQGLVLPPERVGRVSGRGRRRRPLDEDVADDGGVQVAHVHDLRDRNAFGHQLLLHGRNLARVALPHEGGEAGLDLGRRLAFVKVTDDLFQRPDAVGPVVNQFAHARTPPPGGVPGSGAHAG